MGYTHYYGFTKYANQKRINELFPTAVELFKDGLALLPKRLSRYGRRSYLVLCGWDGEAKSKPVINNNEIRFNGKGDYAHETFLLDHNTRSEFCKTARKPYDLAVCMCLLCFKEVFGDDFRYSSDGYCPEDDSVKEGREKLEYEWAKAVKYFDELMAERECRQFVSSK